MATIQLLLADDHESFRRTLRELLDSEPDLHVVGEAADGRLAVSLVRELSPEVVLMDVEMPVLDGIRATREITTDHPGTAVLGLSVHHDRHLAGAMLAAGAAGYLPKDEDLPILIRVIRAIAGRSHRGSRHEPPSAVGRWNEKESDDGYHDWV